MPPITIFVTIACHTLSIEIDTGASISLLNWETFQKVNYKSDISLLPTKSKLKTYSGEIASTKGRSDIEFTYEVNKIKTTFLITDEHLPNVLGREILGNLTNIFNLFAASEISSTSDNETMNKILSDYKVVFSDDYGALKDFQANIPIDPQITPKYFCARPVPNSLKQKIECELERLVKLGIYCPVTSSKCAAPIVPVFKGDGSIIFVVIIKQTVNKAANCCDKYPIPKTEDIFAALNGWSGGVHKTRSRFESSLSATSSPNSRELLTINTHRGLFQCTRSGYNVGVHSASGVL